MPEITEIKKFNDYLVSFGSEPEILADKGEEIEDIQPPEAKISGDLAELLGTEGESDVLTDTFEEQEPPDEKQPEELSDSTEITEDLTETPDENITKDEIPEPETLFEEPEQPEQEPEELSDSTEITDIFTEGQAEEFSFETPEDIPEVPAEPSDLADEFTDIFTEGEGEEPSFDIPDELPELPSDEEQLTDEISEPVSESPEFIEEEITDESTAEEPEDLSSMELDSLFSDEKTKDENEIDILPKDFEDFSPDEKGEEIPTDDIYPEFETEDETENEQIAEAEPEPEETFDDIKLDAFETDKESEEFTESDLLGEEKPGISGEELESIDDISQPKEKEDLDFEMPDEFQMLPEETKPEDEIPEIPDLDESFLSDEKPPEDISLPSDDGMEDFSAPADERIDEISTPVDQGMEDISTPEDESLQDLGTDDFQIDEFSLPEIGEEFGLKDQDTAKEPPEELDTEIPSSFEIPEEIPGETPEMEEAGAFESAEPGEQQFSDNQFRAIQNTLSNLPLNLRIAVEELIGVEQIAGDNLKKLLDALIQKRTAKEIASIVSKLTGKRISIPKRFEKKTGIEFERERKTFGYAFRKNIVPLLKIMLPALAVLAVIVFGTIYLLMIPLWANDVYQKGYDLLLENYFKEADEKFYTAFNILPEQHWMLKNWFYMYADAYEERKQYDYARDKYQLLLRVYPDDKDGILGWAGLESGIHEFEESNRILDYYMLENEPFDFDALLLKGDNYFNWAKSDPENSELHLKDAQDTYERLLLKHSNKDDAWLHLLSFTIYTDNYEQTMHIKQRFDDNKNARVDPLIYSELAGYLIDKNELLDVDDVLERAKKIDETLPEIHYQYSRYFKETGKTENEEIALTYVIDYLLNNKDESLSIERQKERLVMQINSYNRMGEIFVDRGLIEDAEEKFFDIAIAHIENGQSEKGAGNLDYSPEFGKVYSNKGDLYYYYDVYGKALDPDDFESFIFDESTSEDYIDYFFDIALENYLSAEKNHYEDPELTYKIGVIKYSQGEFEEAFKKLYSLRSAYSNNTNFIFSLGNTLYNKRDYYGAQGYFKYLIELLEQKKSEIVQLRPDEEHPDDLNLVYNLCIAHNNIGVIYAKLSELNREPEKEIQAKVHFLRSSQYADQILRDSETLQRGDSQAYGYLNTQEILKDKASKIYLYYNILPKNFTINNWQEYEEID